MATHHIDEYVGILSLKLVRITGDVTVSDPQVALTLKVDPPVFSAHTYHVKVSPQHPDGSDSHDFGSGIFKVTVTLGMKLDMQRSLVRVSIQANGKEQWSYPYPYGGVHGIQPIEMFGIGAFIEPISRYADHTYAIATNAQGAQLIWRCGGDYEGGHSLGKGKGNADLCDCLSCRTCDEEKELGGLARIRYAIDGVCHQAANRILYPAAMEVTKARAYAVSHHLYGRLGLLAPDHIGELRWAELTRRCGVPAVASVADGAEVTREDVERANVRLSVELAAPAATEAEVNALMAERDGVVAARGDFTQQLMSGRVEARAFADRVNALAAGYLDAARSALSADTFTAVFGPLSDKERLLVNPRIAERAFANGVPASYRSADPT